MSRATLYYVHDLMCSWCWGFRPVWQQLQSALSGKVTIRYLLGGLAADNDQPMPAEVQANIKNTWAHIQQEIPGTKFNFDFWRQNQPRHSTYPACRAIIASKMQKLRSENEMRLAIQQAYYPQTRTPSEPHVLVDLANSIGLNTKQFSHDTNSELCQNSLTQEIEFCRDIDVYSFSSLVLNQGKQ